MTTETQVKERPILFSTPMVQAILAGRKTMTRRVVKPQPNELATGFRFKPESWPGKPWVASYRYDGPLDIFEITDRYKCPYGQVGDVLWARETWTAVNHPTTGEFHHHAYRANGCPLVEGFAKWNPSIHMPRAACRIRLRITDIRVERVQDITPGDACDEGVEYWNIDTDAFEGGELVADFKNYMWKDDESYEDYYFPHYADPVSSFRSLWQSINGTESWNVNPFCWVISFEKI